MLSPIGGRTTSKPIPLGPPPPTKKKELLCLLLEAFGGEFGGFFSLPQPYIAYRYAPLAEGIVVQHKGTRSTFLFEVTSFSACDRLPDCLVVQREDLGFRAE